MKIVVSYKKIYGKDLFYPVSDDAKFLAELTGRPTILKRQLNLCVKKGWEVLIEQPNISINLTGANNE